MLLLLAKFSPNQFTLPRPDWWRDTNCAHLLLSQQAVQPANMNQQVQHLPITPAAGNPFGCGFKINVYRQRRGTGKFSKFPNPRQKKFTAVFTAVHVKKLGLGKNGNLSKNK
ncbi:hypothetical protein XENORESO_015078 [Xenotaenia resolanae]|uniref:Uncharacterized protein n=1 Tax=Xenotaenia resolanae TaxID=208358 RepID=A0ABV0X4B9_9TELE